MGAIGGLAAPRPRGQRRRRFATFRPRRRMVIVVGVAGAILLILIAVTLVRLTPAPVPAAGLGAGPGPASSSSPDGPGVGGSTRGTGPETSPEAGGSSGAGACLPFPSFPDETCTGYRHTGVTLRPCPTVITQDGATFDSCRFSPDLEVQARDVTITRSLVEGTVYATYLTDWSLENLTLIDVEIDGQQRVTDGRSAAIGNDNYTCIRCHIHDSERGANLGHNVRIEHSYLHDWIVSPGAHQTAIGSNGGTGYAIIHNTLECRTSGGCSSSLSLYEDFEPISDVLIQNNLFNTDGGYCTYAGQSGTNIRYIDNVFGTQFHPRCGEFGPVTDYAPNQGNVWRGNRYPDGSQVPSGDG